jgi:Zn-dependent protease
VNTSQVDVRWVLISVFVLIVSVALHEFGHALMATLLGDDTPRRQGRVTLNPLAHADPIGTLLLPLLGGLYFHGGGFGWGKPVQWQPSRVNRKWRMATAQILVALAGPLMNLILAVAITAVLALLVSQQVVTYDPDAAHTGPFTIMTFAVVTNFVLFFFNLVPAPPLDGGHVAQGLTPYRYRAQFDSYARFGPFVVLALVAIPPLPQIFLTPAFWCTKHLYTLFGIF